MLMMFNYLSWDCASDFCMLRRGNPDSTLGT